MIEHEFPDSLYCPECNGKAIESNGYLVCSNCGLVLDRVYLTETPEKQLASVSWKEREKRKGHYVGELGSFIFSPHENFGNSRLSPEVINKYKRLQRLYHIPSKLHKQQSHISAINSLRYAFDKLNIPKDLQEQTLTTYWKIVKSSKRKFTNHVLLGALCLLLVIRNAKNRAPVTLNELIQVFAERGHRVTNKSLLTLARELNIHRKYSFIRKETDYLPRLISKLHNSQEIQELVVNHYNIDFNKYLTLLNILAKRLLSEVHKNKKTSVQPYGLAAASIYGADRVIASALKKQNILTQQRCAKILGISPFTIRDHSYKLLHQYFSIIKKEALQLIDQQKAV